METVSKISSKNVSHDRMTNMTNVSGSERGSQHPSSGLATWILGFVFVTIISLSSMLGLLLIPSSGITTSARTADDSPLTPEGQHDVNVMRQKNASSIRTTGINSESPVSSFVSLGSECNHGERLDDGLTMRRSSDSWMGKDGERASSSRSFSFSTSYLHNGLEGLALGSLLASSIFHLIPHAFDLIGQGMFHAVRGERHVTCVSPAAAVAEKNKSATFTKQKNAST